MELGLAATQWVNNGAFITTGKTEITFTKIEFVLDYNSGELERPQPRQNTSHV